MVCSPRLRLQRTSTLLALVTVLGNYLEQVAFDPLGVVSSPTGALFRTFWYTCLLSGFLSSRAPLSEYQRSAVLAVAKRSPPLVVGIGVDLVEAEAQLQALLKSPRGHVLSVEAVRGELAAAVPSQASAARSVSDPQAVFLATILRLESMRAEAGAFAPVFLYLGVPALSGESPLADAVQSIGDRVLSTFTSRLSGQAPHHAMDAGAYNQVRSVLLHTTNSSASVRATAMRYLDNLLASFPSLVCNLGVITVMLELLTVLRRACLDEFVDEVRLRCFPFLETPPPTASDLLMLTRPRSTRPPTRSIRFAAASPSRSPTTARCATASCATCTLTCVRGSARASPARRSTCRVSSRSTSTSRATATRWPCSTMTRWARASHSTWSRRRRRASASVRLSCFPSDCVVSLTKRTFAAALPAWGDWKADAATAFARTFAAKSFFGGEAQRGCASFPLAPLAQCVDPEFIAASSAGDVLGKLELLAEQLADHKLPLKLSELRDLFYRGAAQLVKAREVSISKTLTPSALR